MTIDEAIKHCEEVAEKNEITAKSNLIEVDKIKADGILRIYDANEYESCLECAIEHRQLAEWLKELQIYRKKLTEIEEAVNFYKGCETCQGFREYPTSEFVKDLVRILEVQKDDE